ncbi:CPBP family intramembrane glutamic endopeptidase [Melioribacteraceae bacterium 4301-Me]|uniref:CPBP family intramembrane glutamic endopeptidase n=1 Tax=Pyranulibacter aquaticus TaxID=3163344 RepID=UPI0035955330
MIEFSMKRFKLIIKDAVKELSRVDRKIIIIFLSVAVLEILSWYYTSRNFFHENLYYKYFVDNPNVDLYEFLYWFLGDFIVFLIIPLLIIKFWFKEEIKNYGMKLGEYKEGISISMMLIAIMLIIVWFASATEDFYTQYPLLYLTKYNWNIFFLFEIFLFIYIVAWEFIWRGYMLFGLEEKFGFYSIFVQMIPFVILHNGKPVAEAFGAILGAIILGILALRTRSFFYGVVIHFTTVFSIDLISILRYRYNEYGVGLSSILKIITKTL